jgi:hypothetical protein
MPAREPLPSLLNDVGQGYLPKHSKEKPADVTANGLPCLCVYHEPLRDAVRKPFPRLPPLASDRNVFTFNEPLSSCGAGENLTFHDRQS